MQHGTCGPLLLVSSKRKEACRADVISCGRVVEILAGRSGGRRISGLRLVLVKGGEESKKAEGNQGESGGGNAA